MKIEDLQISTGDIIPEWSEEDKTKLKEVLEIIFDMKDAK